MIRCVWLLVMNVICFLAVIVVWIRVIFAPPLGEFPGWYIWIPVIVLVCIWLITFRLLRVCWIERG